MKKKKLLFILTLIVAIMVALDIVSILYGQEIATFREFLHHFSITNLSVLILACILIYTNDFKKHDKE